MSDSDTDGLSETVQEVQATAKDALDDSVVHGIIRAGTLQQWVDTIGSLVDECRVHYSEDGWRVSAVDPGNVASYQDAVLDPDAFDSWDAPGSVTMGIDLRRFDEVLGPANDGDLAEFAIDMENRKLRLQYRNISQAMALIDPDAVRTEPDKPDLELPNTLTITGAQFDDVVTVSDATSDHLAIEGRPDEKQTVFVAEGDIDDSVVSFGQEESADPTKVPETTRALFSTDYLEELAAPVPDDAPVTFNFGDEFPIRIKYDSCDGHLDVHAMCAPRIE